MRLVWIFAIASCGPPADSQEHREATIESFSKRMCACRDKVCATLVIDDFGKWTRKIPADAPKPDPAITAPIMAQYNECMKRALATP